MDVLLEVVAVSETNGTFDCVGANVQETWILSIVASCAVGLSGILPLFLIPVEMGQKFNTHGGDCKFLRLLLSFAVGGLLGDVFLHLLPEAWNTVYKKDSISQLYMGGWILTGIVTFIIIEMLFTVGHTKPNNVETTKCAKKIVEDLNTQKQTVYSIHISGYLNLLANAFDNFSHGLAVAASFIVSTKMGMLTTVAILIHEIPHEVGDFAILLKSGFDRWAAAKAQLSTALIGVMGAIVALSANSLEDVGEKTSWILPFTAGGFLNIALVNILPDLMKEKDPKESFKQIIGICGGIAIMGFVGLVAE